MAGRAETLASRFVPRAAEEGMCHGDLCAENIVLDRDGHVVVVDNDNLAVDAWGYDFARTWYRWPMSEAERRQYMAGYGRADHLVAVDAHFVHWVLVVLVEAAAYRVRVAVGGADRAVGALQMVLQDPVRCARFPGLIASGACTP
jgi:Ser/Thr protein kinase RdoA (MazF antagonist)